MPKFPSTLNVSRTPSTTLAALGLPEPGGFPAADSDADRLPILELQLLECLGARLAVAEGSGRHALGRRVCHPEVAEVQLISYSGSSWPSRFWCS